MGGASEHCESRARTKFHQVAFDWLDETLMIAGQPSGVDAGVHTQ
jgi:hypothetical protein